LLETAIDAHRASGGHVAVTAPRTKPWTVAMRKPWTGPALVAVASAGALNVHLEIARPDEFASAEPAHAALEAVMAETSSK
jgi:hypothetical protein